MVSSIVVAAVLGQRPLAAKKRAMRAARAGPEDHPATGRASLVTSRRHEGADLCLAGGLEGTWVNGGQWANQLEKVFVRWMRNKMASKFSDWRAPPKFYLIPTPAIPTPVSHHGHVAATRLCRRRWPSGLSLTSGFAYLYRDPGASKSRCAHAGADLGCDASAYLLLAHREVPSEAGHMDDAIGETSRVSLRFRVQKADKPSSSFAG